MAATEADISGCVTLAQKNADYFPGFEPSYPWSDASVETIEAVMDAVGLRPYEETSGESADWKTAFEKSLMENYQVTVKY